MKFVPRQPHPPTEQRSVARGTTTTRFLRLQRAEEAGDEGGAADPSARRPAQTEPRPLPMPPETAPLPSGRTASQRVRLRLDPEIATQPLPESQWPAFPAPAAEPVWTPEPESGPEGGTAHGSEAPRAFEESVSPASPASAAEPMEAAAEQRPHGDWAGTAYAPFVNAAAVEQAGLERPSNEFLDEPPEEPSAPADVPVKPDSSWLTGTKRLTPPAQPGSFPVRSGAQTQASSPVSLSRVARGERPAGRRRFAARGAEGKEAAAVVSTDAGPARDSQPLPRPELRRPSFTPLAGKVRPERSLGPGFWIVLVLVIILLVSALYFFGALPRIVALLAPQVGAPVAAERVVTYAVARQIVAPVVLPLSGRVEPFQQTALYARTTGYVRDWRVDIGDPVQAGQVMAELDTPDVDHQLTQARATADAAKARLALAQDEAKRWDAMAAAHAVSQQDADEKDSARDEAQAGFNAAQASVARLVDLELFKEIRAPYAGRVTARNLEVGTLVAAGPGSAGSELFQVAQTDPVRVFVQVPEANAPAIRPGLEARIVVDAFPERVFRGTVVRDAGILDGTTHTLRTELRVANPDGALLPGAQAGVRLQLGVSTPVVLIPADTLVAQRGGVSVAKLSEANGRDVVHFTPVTVGRDFGADVEVLDNVREGDRLVSHPPADLQDGTAVNARPFEQAPLPSLLPPKPSAPRA